MQHKMWSQEAQPINKSCACLGIIFLAMFAEALASPCPSEGQRRRREWLGARAEQWACRMSRGPCGTAAG